MDKSNQLTLVPRIISGILLALVITLAWFAWSQKSEIDKLTLMNAEQMQIIEEQKRGNDKCQEMLKISMTEAKLKTEEYQTLLAKFGSIQKK